MRRIISIAGISALILALISLAGPRESGWKKVEDAVNKGLPRTAVEQLEIIIQQAIREKAYGEALKAICKKISLEALIQGNKPEEKIVRMQAEIAKAPEEMVPLMEAILANWFWHYFQQNRWRFFQRTQTLEPPGKDFTTWDLTTILQEISRHFERALSAEKKLQETPVTVYQDFLIKGTVPDSYRPTLYDFIVHNALQFYTSGEQAASRPEDDFELSADSPIFAGAEEFLQWKVKTETPDSPVYKAVVLYQKLLAFHQKDEDRSAFLDADLQRLNFAYNQSYGEEKKERYLRALKRFVEKWADYEISSLARYYWARVLQQDNQLVDAHQVAKAGYHAFPESAGGKLCYNLIKQIESKYVSIQTEKVWNQPWPKIKVIYRNVDKVFFRAIPFDFEKRLQTGVWNPEYLNHQEEKQIISWKALQEWSCDLPQTADYRERVEEVSVPENLPAGFYFILASHHPSFSQEDNQISVTCVWVSRLAVVWRTASSEAAMEGFVLTAREGEPVTEATVKLWERDNSGNWKLVSTVKTDQNGFFQFSEKSYRSGVIVISCGNDILASSFGYVSRGQTKTGSVFAGTVFFTDRSLYRPGQVINYKGICFQVDGEKNNYEVLRNQKLVVVFSDVNGKEISRQEKKTNEYGSFSGWFVAPVGRLTGQMSLQVESGPPGRALVRVEEYKRPRFQVVLQAPEQPVRLNSTVVLKGKATAYTGAAIGGAKVKYRVIREPWWPAWYRWYRWWQPPPAGSQEISHGLVTTESDGTFTISFPAKPDLSISEKQKPFFRFTIYADVTDITGETRSAQKTINVGYTCLQASLSAPEWQTADEPVEIAIRTTTLDGLGQPASGVVKVYLLKKPDKVVRQQMGGFLGRHSEKEEKLSDPNSWPVEEVIKETSFTAGSDGSARVSFQLPAGAYRAILETKDASGEPVTAFLPLLVLDLKNKKLSVPVPHILVARSWSVEVGQTFLAVWATGYQTGRSYIELECQGKILRSWWTDRERTQEIIEQMVTEEMRGGFTLRVTYVRENRAYLESKVVDVPYSNKNLVIQWERFVSRLEPGAKEKWSAVISGPDASKVAAEMVATLYDASLDAYLAHLWPTSFNHYFRRQQQRLRWVFGNCITSFQPIAGYWAVGYLPAELRYREFPEEVTANLWGYQYSRRASGMVMSAAPEAALAAEKGMADKNAFGRGETMPEEATEVRKRQVETPAEDQAVLPEIDLSAVIARKNLNETAFFFPHLISGSDGVVKIEFTMPEALTEWKFLGFAHDQKLRSGFLTDKVVTAKDLMVQPNPPRFLRENDIIDFVVKITNNSPTRQTGKVRLNLSELRTLKSVDKLLGNIVPEKTFDLACQESVSVSWRLKVPEGTDFLIYKTVASTGRLSDGEEGYLPVLSGKILVVESLPLPVKGPARKNFTFKKLLDASKSNTLRHQSLTLQMVSNPSWYAVLALPYLMEYPYECVEQTFNRLYANALAQTIVNSEAKIRRIFEQWRSTDILDSPLEKNQDLKTVILEETPWLRQAQAESQARRNIALLFEEKCLNEETERLLQKIGELQLPDGAWSWFPGGRPNDYITLYITTGFGRLRHLGVDIDVKVALKSLNRLDKWIERIYREILQKGNKNDNHLTNTVALYLYGRSFFLKDKTFSPAEKEAIDYFLSQAKKYWLSLSSRQSQAHVAVALKRFGDKETASAIMKSIRERAVTDEEMGMFWRDTEFSWWWYRAPIETQAMMIEAFDEVCGDKEAVENCKIWLLKQKQTQDWKTTKATADAIYALLLRGTNLLTSDVLVEVSLGNEVIKPDKVEAGTGFYQRRFIRNEVKPDMGRVTVKKLDSGIAWGGLHWQYLEEIDKVSAYEGTPLKLRKTLFVRQYTKKGPVLKPVEGLLSVGDELVVRLELRADRDMEYVHLKDQRPSGTEPVDVLSGYRYQDGLAYYQSTRDTASHFFIDYLPKGTYVFEYAVRIQLAGEYQTGPASIQCLYAPEFNSHSESFKLVVK